jgi:hypothetical protein
LQVDTLDVWEGISTQCGLNDHLQITGAKMEGVAPVQNWERFIVHLPTREQQRWGNSVGTEDGVVENGV